MKIKGIDTDKQQWKIPSLSFRGKNWGSEKRSDLSAQSHTTSYCVWQWDSELLLRFYLRVLPSFPDSFSECFIRIIKLSWGPKASKPWRRCPDQAWKNCLIIELKLASLVLPGELKRKVVDSFLLSRSLRCFLEIPQLLYLTVEFACKKAENLSYPGTSSLAALSYGHNCVSVRGRPRFACTQMKLSRSIFSVYPAEDLLSCVLSPCKSRIFLKSLGLLNRAPRRVERKLFVSLGSCCT